MRRSNAHLLADMFAEAIELVSTGRDPMSVVCQHIGRRISASASSHAWMDARTGTSTLQVWSDDPFDLDLMVASGRNEPLSHPVIAHYLSGHDGVVAISEVVADQRAWRNSRGFSLMQRGMGWTETAGIKLGGGPGRVDMLGFGRPGDFTSKDMDFLRLVDRPVVSLYRHARTLAAWRSRLDLPDHDIPGLCGQVGLTARETEVLYLLSTGLPAKSIARRMAVSPRTVHRHLSSIYAKFGTHDRLTTVVRAQRLGLLPQSG